MTQQPSTEQTGTGQTGTGQTGTERSAPGMTGALTALFAISAGVVVGNLYWAQPLLDDIANGMRISTGSTGLLITVVQIGYALGVFLIVPLGDSVARRMLIPAVMAVSVAGLVATAVAPSYLVLVIAMFVIGLSSVTGQLLTPLAGDLAEPGRRGRTISMVASGLMLGILLARAVSGVLADLWGWRSVFLIAAAANLLFALLLARAIPTLPTPRRVKYGTLLRAVLTEVRDSAPLRTLMVMGACIMAVFTMFWTGLTFLLSAAPYHFSATQIGLVSLVGVIGAGAAQLVGRLFDRGLALPTIGAGLAMTLLSMAVSAFTGENFVMVLLVAAVSSVGFQTTFVLVQTCVMALNPQARSRLNTAIIVGNFAGGAVGSTLAALLWGAGGWPLLAGTAGAIAILGLLVWATQRNRTLAGLRDTVPVETTVPL